MSLYFFYVLIYLPYSRLFFFFANWMEEVFSFSAWKTCVCCLFYSHLHQRFFGLQQTVTGCVAQQNSYMNTDATWNVNGADTIHTNVCVCVRVV